MADIYATIDQADLAVQERLADVLELRAADLQQRVMLDTYLDDLPLASGSRVLEIGCGTGAVARRLAERFQSADVVGVDPSPVFIEHAQRRARHIANLTFVFGDGRQLPFENREFDAVVCHTSLCHIPGPDRVLAEAARVTADGAWLAVFDGDYATTTVAVAASDPLQACADAAVEALVHDRFLVRRLPALVGAAGWDPVRTRSHGYVETADPQYMLTIVDRGADVLAQDGRIGIEAAEALKAEARRRAESDEFFGHIAYVSLVARRAR